MVCKLCNNALKSSEVIWYPAEKRHEDLCSRCRGKVAMDMVDAGWDDSHIIVESILEDK